MFAIAFGVAFVLTWMFGYKDEVQETAEKNIEAEKKSDAPAEIAQEKTSETGAQTLYSPLEGTAIPLSEVKDATFASEVLGRGMAVIPSKGEVKAPCDATVSTIFDTKHAIGFQTDTDLPMLLHIGIDTVKLEGKGFEILVEQGQHVKKGEPLMKIDIPYLIENAPSLCSPILCTEIEDNQRVRPSCQWRDQSRRAAVRSRDCGRIGNFQQ